MGGGRYVLRLLQRMLGLGGPGRKAQGVQTLSSTVPQMGWGSPIWPRDWRPSGTRSATPCDGARASHPSVRVRGALAKTDLPAEGRVETEAAVCPWLALYSGTSYLCV
jgi:hypothetical protein